MMVINLFEARYSLLEGSKNLDIHEQPVFVMYSRHKLLIIFFNNIDYCLDKTESFYV
jgi:hypothetical protein